VPPGAGGGGGGGAPRSGRASPSAPGPPAYPRARVSALGTTRPAYSLESRDPLGDRHHEAPGPPRRAPRAARPPPPPPVSPGGARLTTTEVLPSASVSRYRSTDTCLKLSVSLPAGRSGGASVERRTRRPVPGKAPRWPLRTRDRGASKAQRVKEALLPSVQRRVSDNSHGGGRRTGSLLPSSGGRVCTVLSSPPGIPEARGFSRG